MHPVLFDSSIYIAALRAGDEAALTLKRLAANSPLWLSSVVLEELYAGVARRSRHVLERLERDFERAKRILVPNLNDWTQTGKVLARLAARYDYERIGIRPAILGTLYMGRDRHDSLRVADDSRGRPLGLPCRSSVGSALATSQTACSSAFSWPFQKQRRHVDSSTRHTRSRHWYLPLARLGLVSHHQGRQIQAH
jgi:predicted nucleic acid-binding protein